MLDHLGQRLSANAIAAAVLVMTASALIWVGVGFAGYALYMAVLPNAGAPLAAAISAVILVIAPLGWAAIVYVRARANRPRFHPAEVQVTQADPEAATLSLLAKLAQEKPLLAVVFAGILGASQAIQHRKS
jgi:membrane protein YdbS with pleckstrin-like domain